MTKSDIEYERIFRQLVASGVEKEQASRQALDLTAQLRRKEREEAMAAKDNEDEYRRG